MEITEEIKQTDPSSAEPSKSEAPSIVKEFLCPGCGASAEFSPKDGQLVCPYCGQTQPLPEPLEALTEHDYSSALVVSEERMSKLSAEALEVECKSCGSVTEFIPPEVAKDCPFCGTAINVQPKSADPVVTPQGVLPFKVTKNDAQKAVQTWIAGRWFAPNELKRFAMLRGVTGTYIPFWTYDSKTTTPYQGQRGDYYYETEYYTATNSEGKTERRSRQVRKTRWGMVFHGQVSRDFDDVLVAASTSLSAEHLDELEPWDLPELKPFDDGYLAGFKAQRAQRDTKEGFALAQKIMDRTIYQDIKRSIGGDEQRVYGYHTTFDAVTFKHILLPVYVGAYHFKDKVFQVLVNARTAEVQGSRPYSTAKIVAAIISGLLLVTFLILFFYQQN